MNPKNQRRITDEEALEQTRRNRLRSAIFELRSGPVLPEDALRLITSPKDSAVAKSKASSAQSSAKRQNLGAPSPSALPIPIKATPKANLRSSAVAALCER